MLFAEVFVKVKLVGATDFNEYGDDVRGKADWPTLPDVLSDAADTNDFSLSDGDEPSRALPPITRAGIAG